MTSLGLRCVSSRFTLALVACVLFAAAEPAFAQRAMGGSRSGKTQPRGQPGQSGKKAEPANIDQPGIYRGQISKFETTTDEKDEDLVGTLTIRPIGTGKTLKVQVRRNDNFRVQIGDRQLEFEVCADLLWKGLCCSADWDWLQKIGDKGKPTTRELRALTLESMPVSGVIEEIEGEYITIKARPREGMDWPDAVAKDTPVTPQRGTETRPKQAAAKKLRLKIVEDVSDFRDAAAQSLDLGDFAVEQQIEAKIVYGKKQGILVELRSLTASESKEGDRGADRRTDQRGRGDVPPPRGAGPVPRGRPRG